MYIEDILSKANIVFTMYNCGEISTWIFISYVVIYPILKQNLSLGLAAVHTLYIEDITNNPEQCDYNVQKYNVQFWKKIFAACILYGNN